MKPRNLGEHRRILSALPLVAMFALTLTGCEDRKNASTSPKNAETIAAANRDSVFLLESISRNGDPVSTGTAFVAGRPEWLVTNAHVVAQGASFRAKADSGAYFEITKIVHLDEASDLAVLEVEAKGLTPLHLAEQLPSQGAACTVLGSPLGLDLSVSTGIVAAIQEAESGSLLQITAPISPGSSGSPVFATNGDVLGVATRSFTDGQNLNVAVAAPTIRRILEMAASGQVPGESAVERPEVDVDDLLDGKSAAEQIPLLKRFIAEHPQDAGAFVRLIWAFSELDLQEEVQHTLLGAARNGIESVDFYWTAARFVSDDALKIKFAKRALALDPADPHCWTFLSDQYRYDDDEEALRVLDKGLRQLSPPLDPGKSSSAQKERHLDTYVLLHEKISILCSLGRTERAEEALTLMTQHWSKVLHSKPQHDRWLVESRISIASRWQRQDQNKRSYAVLKPLVDYYRSCPPENLQKCWEGHHSGKWRTYLESAARLLLIFEKDADARRVLALTRGNKQWLEIRILGSFELYLVLKDHENATKMLAFEESAQDTDERAAQYRAHTIAEMKGLIKLAEGDLSGAKAAFLNSPHAKTRDILARRGLTGFRDELDAFKKGRLRAHFLGLKTK